MNIELSEIEYRRLLDLVYIGNWVLNSTRGSDRIDEYDAVESRIFSYCPSVSMNSLAVTYAGVTVPSDEYAEGGIHEAIADYESTVFYDILAQELAFRDMDITEVTEEKYDELNNRVEEYLAEFEENGLDNLTLDQN